MAPPPEAGSLSPPEDAAGPGAKARPAARTRPPRRRHRTGLAGRLVFLLLACLAALAVYGLTGRPITLPVWAVAEIEQRLNAAAAPVMPGGAVSVGEVDLAVDDDWVPRIRLGDLRVLKPDGAALLTLPELRMDIDPGALLRGRLQPRSLTLSGARIAIRRDRAGRYDFAFGSDAAMPEITSLAQLFDLADKAMSQPAAASLTRIEAEALTLSLADERTGRMWTVGDGRLTVENRPDALAGELGVSLLDGAAAGGRAVLTLVSPKDSETARLSASFDGIAAQDLAAQSPLIAPLAVLDAPISGRLTTTLAAEGVTALEGELEIGAGALRPTPAAQPIAFDRARLALRYDQATGRVALDDLAVEGPSLRLSADGQTFLIGASGQRLKGPLGGGLPDSFLTQIRFRDVKIDPAGLFQEPVQFSAGGLDLRLRLDPFRVEIGQLSLAEDARRLSAKGQIAADARGWSASVDLTLNEITHDRLVAMWPVSLVPKTREWVEKNILQGEMTDLTAALRITPGAEPRLHLGYNFQSADVRIINTLPPILDGYGYSTIEGRSYTLVMSRGRLQPPQGGSIDVSGSVFAVPDITRKPALADVHLVTRSSLTAALSLLDQKPFEFLTKAGQPVDLGEGEAQVDARLRLPLQNRIGFGDVEYQVTGRITGFRSGRIVPGREVTSQGLEVRASPEGMTISGPGHIGAVPFNVTYSQSFAPADRGQARIEGTVELSQAAATEFGLGLPEGTVAGTGQAQVTIRLQKGQPGRLSLVSDLNQIALRLPDVGWSKPAAATGRLEAQVTLGAVPKVDRLTLDAAGLKAEGSVTVRPGGGLEEARFSRVTLSEWLDGAVTITGRGPGKPAALAVTSGRIDIRRMPPASARKGSGQGGGPLSLTLDRLVVSSGIALTGFRGEFSLAGGLRGEYAARVNDGAAVSGTLAPSPHGTAIRVLSKDGGAVLRDAGIFQSAYGGDMSVLIVPRASDGAYDGRVRIDNVRVRNANVLAELLNAISVVGLLEQLDGAGLVFNEAEGEFILTPRAVQVTRGSAIGASLGVSMAGVYQTGSGRLDMQGVVSPIYIVNGIGALLTRKGEGVFGFNYGLRGTADNPEVSVNPLSILTPGMFREIFRQPPPVLQEGKK
jgi:hypothetical protein